MNIKKDDNVIVITGKDKGKSGKVIKSIPKDGKVVVSGINIRKVHEKSRKADQKGQIVEKSMPINVSNVSLIDPKSNKATRIGFKMEGDKKVRISKKSEAKI